MTYDRYLSTAELESHRDHWLEIGLATGPTDMKKARQGISLAYEAVGLAPPKNVVCVRSPQELFLAMSLLDEDQVQVRGQVLDQARDPVWGRVWDRVCGQVQSQVQDQVQDQVWSQVWDQIWAQVSDQVRDQIRDQVRIRVSEHVKNPIRDQVSDEVRNQVWKQVRDRVRTQVWNQIWAQVSDQVRDQVRTQISNQFREQFKDQLWEQVCYGSHDAHWLAQYTIFKDIPEVKKLEGLVMLAESTGWFIPYRDMVILSDRPSCIYRKSGGAVGLIEYSDGFYVNLGMNEMEVIAEASK